MATSADACRADRAAVEALVRLHSASTESATRSRSRVHGQCSRAQLDQGALLELADTLGRHAQPARDLAQRQLLTIHAEAPSKYLLLALGQRRNTAAPRPM